MAYSNTNVTLIGISGGVSYGALGMSHHSAQDIAAMSAIPNMRVYLPSDRFQSAKLIEALLKDEKPAYIRVGRNAVEDIYREENCPFEMGKATVISYGSNQDSAAADEEQTIDGETSFLSECGDGKGRGTECAPRDCSERKMEGAEGRERAKVSTESHFDDSDVVIIACGEMVKPSCDAAAILAKEGMRSTVLDMYCVKPLDEEAVIKAARSAKAVLTVEEHAPFGGLGSMVSQVVGSECPKKVVNLALPDAPVITGTSKEVFDYYGLNAEGIAQKAMEILQH
ncbi:MAG: transketolase family protein [Lachnospiraceae bacterium]|nr:transketolase family protein [Lachnospiraceae bacterium]